MLGTHVRHHMPCRVSYEEEDTCMSSVMCRYMSIVRGVVFRHRDSERVGV